MTSRVGLLKSQVAQGLASATYVLEAHGTVDYENSVLSLRGSPQGNTQLTLEVVGKRIFDVA